jgi:hypothetical protein
MTLHWERWIQNERNKKGLKKKKGLGIVNVFLVEEKLICV